MKAQTGIKLSDSIKQAIEALKSDSTAAKVRNDAITHLYEAMAAVQSDFESNKAGLPPLPEPLLHNGYRQPGPNQYARPESGFTAGQIQAYALEFSEAKVAQTKGEALRDAIKTVESTKLEHESDHSEGAGFNQGVDACIEALTIAKT